MKKQKFPKPKKIKKSTIKKKCDALFSQLVRSIGYCQAESKVKGVKCGGVLQCAHIENRSNLRLRWDMMNALSLCFGHHFWFHRHPLAFVEFLLTHYKEKFDYVMAHKDELNQETFEEVYNRLKMT